MFTFSSKKTKPSEVINELKNYLLNHFHIDNLTIYLNDIPDSVEEGIGMFLYAVDIDNIDYDSYKLLLAIRLNESQSKKLSNIWDNIYTLSNLLNRNYNFQLELYRYVSSKLTRPITFFLDKLNRTIFILEYEIKIEKKEFNNIGG